jgi:hypothetical protein
MGLGAGGAEALEKLLYRSGAWDQGGGSSSDEWSAMLTC